MNKAQAERRLRFGLAMVEDLPETVTPSERTHLYCHDFLPAVADERGAWLRLYAAVLQSWGSDHANSLTSDERQALPEGEASEDDVLQRHRRGVEARWLDHHEWMRAQGDGRGGPQIADTGARAHHLAALIALGERRRPRSFSELEDALLWIPAALSPSALSAVSTARAVIAVELLTGSLCDEVTLTPAAWRFGMPGASARRSEQIDEFLARVVSLSPRRRALLACAITGIALLEHVDPLGESIDAAGLSAIVSRMTAAGIAGAQTLHARRVLSSRDALPDALYQLEQFKLSTIREHTQSPRPMATGLPTVQSLKSRSSGVLYIAAEGTVDYGSESLRFPRGRSEDRPVTRGNPEGQLLLWLCTGRAGPRPLGRNARRNLELALKRAGCGVSFSGRGECLSMLPIPPLDAGFIAAARSR